MLVAHIEHGQGLIDADDAPGLDVLRQRPRHPPRAGGEIENPFIALERQHLDQLFRKRAANARHRPAVEFGGMRRIVKARFVLMAVVAPASVFMAWMLMVMVIPLFAAMLVRVLGFVLIRHFLSFFRSGGISCSFAVQARPGA